MALDLAGVAVSGGSAGSSGKVGRSHVLSAMLGDDALAGQAIRVSLGWTSTDAEIDRFLAAWAAMRDRLSPAARGLTTLRSEEHTSELQSLMRISYAVFCLKKKQLKSLKTPALLKSFCNFYILILHNVL